MKRLTGEEMNAISRAIAEPRRFAILQQIAAAESLTCQALREHSEISPATVSHHLKDLCDAGLLTPVREGRVARFTLCRGTWDAYLRQLSEISPTK